MAQSRSEGMVCPSASHDQQIDPAVCVDESSGHRGDLVLPLLRDLVYVAQHDGHNSDVLEHVP